MPRFKTVPRELENPLQRMFGAFLRTERVRLKLSSHDVATTLKISDTYLRLVEAGGATLNQSLILKIIEVFADSKAQTHDIRTIRFDRLALFMVGLHWVGAQMASLGGRNAGRSALESLAESVSDFQRLFEKTKDYFKRKGAKERKTFLEKVAAIEVGKFLQSGDYGQEDLRSITMGIVPVEQLGDLPTMNIDIIIDIIVDLERSLAGRPFVHTDEIAAKWESSRAAQIRSVVGLFQRSEVIINDKNLKRFHYEFLSQEGFKELRMIFLDGGASETNLKADFIKGVRRGRRNADRFGPWTQKETDKVHFLCLPSDKKSSHYITALNILRRRDTAVAGPFEAYWSFEMSSGLHIGFIGVLGENAENIRNLNLRDSVYKVQQFNSLWDALNEKGYRITVFPDNGLERSQHRRALIGISLNNFVSRSPSLLEQLFAWTKEKFDFDLLIGDYLTRHNYEAFSRLVESAAIERAMRDGERVTSRVSPVLARATDTANVISARDLYANRSFTARLDHFERLYAKNADFHLRIDEAVEQFLARQRRSQTTEDVRRHCVAYQLEELVLFELLAESGYGVLVYAGAQLPVMKSIVLKELTGVSQHLEDLTLIEMRFFKKQ